MRVTYDRSWQLLTDDDLRRSLTMHRRALALVEDDETRDFLAALVEDGAREDGRRDRAAALGVPRDAARFTADTLADIKGRIHLDQLCEHELGARLGRERHGVRRGPCPLCKPSEHSDCFAVHVADTADQWYYCHRCLATGDCFSAIMQACGVEFPEAVERLAREGGVPLPAKPRPTAAPASAHANGNGRRPLPIRRNKGN
jgi:hypothetical protein